MEKKENGVREVSREELAEAVGGIGDDGKLTVLVYMCAKCNIIKKVIGRPGMTAPKCSVCGETMHFVKSE